LKAGARAAYKGVPVTGKAAPWIEEFVCRQRMAKLGYREDFGAIDDLKMQAFMIISTEIDKTEQAEMKKRQARKR